MVTNNQVFQFGGNDADDQALESLVTDYATSLTAQASRLDLTGPILPMKVLRRIFTFAMISDCQPINDGDPSPVSPSIAVGALLVK